MSAAKKATQLAIMVLKRARVTSVNKSQDRLSLSKEVWFQECALTEMCSFPHQKRLGYKYTWHWWSSWLCIRITTSTVSSGISLDFIILLYCCHVNLFLGTDGFGKLKETNAASSNVFVIFFKSRTSIQLHLWLAINATKVADHKIQLVRFELGVLAF